MTENQQRRALRVYVLAAVLLLNAAPTWAVLFSDDFNRVDGPIGANWQDIPFFTKNVSPYIASNRICVTYPDDAATLWTGYVDPAQPISASVVFNATDLSVARAALAFLNLSSSTTIFFEVANDMTSTRRISIERDNATVCTGSVALSLSTGTDYTLAASLDASGDASITLSDSSGTIDTIASCMVGTHDANQIAIAIGDNGGSNMGTTCADDFSLDATAGTAPTIPQHDSVVVARAPLTIAIPKHKTTATKPVSIKVTNADDPAVETTPDTIQLAASADCSGVTVGTPDFDPSTPTTFEDTVSLAAGKSKIAQVMITVDGAVLTSHNKKAPFRCPILFTSSTQVSGNIDPNQSNNFFVMDLNAIDNNDSSTAIHETVLQSYAPVKVKIAKHKTSTPKNFKSRVTNADIVMPLEAPATHPIAVSEISDSCNIVGGVDFDLTTLTLDGSVDVGGGKTKAGVHVITAPSTFYTPNRRSPARCTARLQANGPPGDSDGSNNSTTVTIDVIDGNDLP